MWTRLTPLVALGTLVGCAVDEDLASGSQAVTTPLQAYASTSLPIVGSAVGAAQLAADPSYAQTLALHYNEITTENAMKWSTVHPQPTTWNFTDADAIVAFADAQEQGVRGHTLLWGPSSPAWVSDSLGATGMRDAITTHVSTLVGRYRDRVAHWDVVNEAIDEYGQLRSTVFTRTLGTEAFRLAFATAHAADPAAKLAYNDFDIERPGVKQDAVVALLQQLRAAGAPIHEVGLQLHAHPYEYVNRRIDYADLTASIRRFGDLGLDVYVTELDAPIDELSGTEASRLAVQQQVYHLVTAACHAEPACRGVTTWGFTDRYTWLATKRPLPFSTTYATKPAFSGVVDGLSGVAPTVLTPPWTTACTALTSAAFCEPVESDTLSGLYLVNEGGGTAALSTHRHRGERSLRAYAARATITRRGYAGRLQAFEAKHSGTFWLRAMVYLPTTSGEHNFLNLDEVLSPKHGVSIGIDGVGRAVLRTGGTTPVRLVGPVLARNTWLCVEAQVNVLAAGGSATLYVNGTQRLRIASAQTRFASPYGTLKFGINNAPANGAVAEVFLDDIAVGEQRLGCN